MTVDLNLMIALDVLLQERSVTRAAQRLGLSQPTLSTALARLRRHFDDQLLLRVGNGYELTPLGERLLEHTGPALSAADRVFETRAVFDPMTSEREFIVVMADCHLPILGRALAALITKKSPGVRLRFRHSTPELVHNSDEQLRTVDAVVLPQGLLVNTPSTHLYRDRWVCIVSTETWTGSPQDEQQLANRAWVVPYQHPVLGLSPVPRMATDDAGVPGLITTEDFLAIPHLVAGTDRAGLLPERIARLLAPRHGVSVVPAPFHLGDLLESLWWHPLHARDPAHRWLRQIISEAGVLIDQDT